MTEVLHRRVVAVLVNTAAHTLLHGLANGPILAVRDVPEFHRVRWVELALRKLVTLKKKVTHDVRALGGARLQNEHRRVIAGKADEEIWIDELTLVPLALILVERGERPARRRAFVREGVGTGSMRHTTRPVKPRAACLAKCRNDCAQLGVHAAAVVALVVV